MYTGIQSDCNNIIANIKYLSHDELMEILNNDEKIEFLLTGFEQEVTYLKNLESEKEIILTENKSLAEANLAREPQLIEGRESLESASQEGEELAKRIQEKYDEIKAKNGDINLETALALLQTAASEMEGESDDIAKKFLESEIELEEFLDKFVTMRKLMHLRNVKADKLSRMIDGNPYSNTNFGNAPPMNLNRNYFPGAPNNPVPNSLPYPTPNSVPYPVGGINMPLPGGNYFNPGNF